MILVGFVDLVVEFTSVCRNDREGCVDERVVDADGTHRSSCDANYRHETYGDNYDEDEDDGEGGDVVVVDEWLQ